MTRQPIFRNYQFSLIDNLNVPQGQNPNKFITEDISHRIENYELKSFISINDDILDIGCAEGLFCIHLAKLARSTTGIDPIGSHIETARGFAKKYNLTNCHWIQQDFATFCENNTKKFNIVMCFAAHSYIIGTHKRCYWNKEEMNLMDYEKFVNNLVNLTQKDGHIFIEGHPNSDPDHQDWQPLMNILLAKISLVKFKAGRPDRPFGIFKNDR